MTKLATKQTALVTATKRATPIADKIAKAIAPTPIHAFKGKLAVVRNAAIAGVASLAYAEGNARADTIRQLMLCLGAKPSANDIAGAQVEYVIGRVAARLTWPDGTDVATRIAKAREIVTQFAAPAQDGKASKGLRAGQTGRRTIEQHKACRAADVAWAAIKADAGWSDAAGLVAKRAKEKAAKAKRAPAMSTANVAPTVDDLKPGAPLTALMVADHIATQATALTQYANKHAGLVSTDMGAAIKAFHAAVQKEAALVRSIA